MASQLVRDAEGYMKTDLVPIQLISTVITAFPLCLLIKRSY